MLELLWSKETNILLFGLKLESVNSVISGVLQI